MGNNSLTDNEVKQLDAIHTLLTMTLINPNAVESDLQVAIAHLKKKLTTKNTHPLKYVCEDLGLVPPPKPKKCLACEKGLGS